MQRLNESAALNGSLFQQIFSTVDPVIVKQLQSVNQNK